MDISLALSVLRGEIDINLYQNQKAHPAFNPSRYTYIDGNFRSALNGAITTKCPL